MSLPTECLETFLWSILSISIKTLSKTHCPPLFAKQKKGKEGKNKTITRFLTNELGTQLCVSASVVRLRRPLRDEKDRPRVPCGREGTMATGPRRAARTRQCVHSRLSAPHPFAALKFICQRRECVALTVCICIFCVY